MGIEMLENQEVKSGGTIVDTIDIEKFTDIPSAVEYFTVKNEENEIVTAGEDGEPRVERSSEGAYRPHDEPAARIHTAC